MATSASVSRGGSDELEIEIVDAAPPGLPGERATAAAVAPDDALTVWIDDLRETVDDVLEPARRATATTGTVVGSLAHRVGLRRKQRIADGNPRRQSRIRLHLFIPHAVACTRIPAPGVIGATRGGRLLLDAPFSRHRDGLRAPGTLALRGSWPGLPIWIDIDPWWRHQTIVTLSLRSTGRLRYPRRYFPAAYRILRRFVATLART